MISHVVHGEVAPENKPRAKKKRFWKTLLFGFWAAVIGLIVLMVLGRVDVVPSVMVMENMIVEPPLAEGVVADKVRVFKAKRRLQLLSDGKTLKNYNIGLGGNPVGPKQCQGDSKTPEGNYVLDYHNPHSSYYYSIHVSYPAAKDRKKAAELGCNPGGLIMIHGAPNNSPFSGNSSLKIAYPDWTDGCIALSDPEMDELKRAVPAGTPIEILP